MKGERNTAFVVGELNVSIDIKNEVLYSIL